jgi:hypothetical protein
MKTLRIAIVLASALLGIKSASATTYQSYDIHASNCVSATAGAVPQYANFGVTALSSALQVVCPLSLPAQSYTYAYIFVEGYNRSGTDHVSCTIMGTAPDGTNASSSNAALPLNQSASQFNTTSISPAAGNGLLSLQCHLPAPTASGYSYLSYIGLTVGY